MSAIKLERFEECDADRLIGWIGSDRFMTQWGRWRFTYPLTKQQITDYLAETKGETPTRLAFKAICTLHNEVIGHIELDRISQANGTASICRVLIGPQEMRGQGLGKAMIQQLLLIGFNDLRLRRIDLQVYGFNLNAIHCYESLGFVKEGCLRKYIKSDGELWDLVWMGMLLEEWKDKK